MFSSTRTLERHSHAIGARRRRCRVQDRFAILIGMSIRDMRRRERQFRAVAQSGSAFDWGSKGRWFESSRPDWARLIGAMLYADWPDSGMRLCPFRPCGVPFEGARGRRNRRQAPTTSPGTTSTRLGSPKRLQRLAGPLRPIRRPLAWRLPSTLNARYTPTTHRFDTGCRSQELVPLTARSWRSGNSSPR